MVSSKTHMVLINMVSFLLMHKTLRIYFNEL